MYKRHRLALVNLFGGGGGLVGKGHHARTKDFGIHQLQGRLALVFEKTLAAPQPEQLKSKQRNTLTE